MLRTPLLTVAAASLALTGYAGAEVLVQYNFENPSGTSTSTAAPTTQASGVTGGTFSVVDGDDNALEFSTFTSDTAQRSIFENTLNTTIEAGTAPYWTFTASSSTPVLLEDLRFAIGRTGSNDTTARYNVSTSADSHATLLEGTDFTYSAANDEMSAPANQVVDLTGLTLDSTGLTFRIYYADSNTVNNTGGRIDTVILNAVPEPASLALLGLGGLCLLTRQRKSA
jgi:hypothetical protein